MFKETQYKSWFKLFRPRERAFKQFKCPRPQCVKLYSTVFYKTTPNMLSLIKCFFLAVLPFVFKFRKERVKELSASSRKSAVNKKIL